MLETALGQEVRKLLAVGAVLPDFSLPGTDEKTRAPADFKDAKAQAIDPEWAGALPRTMLVAPGGKILWRHSGDIDIVEVRRQILKGLHRTSA